MYQPRQIFGKGPKSTLAERSIWVGSITLTNIRLDWKDQIGWLILPLHEDKVKKVWYCWLLVKDLLQIYIGKNAEIEENLENLENLYNYPICIEGQQEDFEARESFGSLLISYSQSLDSIMDELSSQQLVSLTWNILNWRSCKKKPDY